MGDRITWFENCPNCGGEKTVECYEALSSNMKSKDCDKCDYYLAYDFNEQKDVVKITPIYPNLVKPNHTNKSKGSK